MKNLFKKVLVVAVVISAITTTFAFAAIGDPSGENGKPVPPPVYTVVKP